MSDVVALKLPAQTLQVLLIEDSMSDAVLLESAINKNMAGSCRVHHKCTLDAALDALNHERYDVALLDLSLPDASEFDGLISIQNIAPNLPVVMITAHADESMALRAVERGAQDYLLKDRMDGKAIHRAMQYAVQRKQFEEKLIMQANFDKLTALANRTLFESRVDMALARIRRSGLGLGVFFLDLNRFKQVNDTLGHAAGDKLLKQVAAKLTECIRPYDTAARFGGDEFALLIEGIDQPRDCATIAQKVIDQLSKPFRIGGKQVDIGVSIGIVTCTSGEQCSRDTMMQQADEAMYGAKLSGHSNYRFYTPEIHEQAASWLRLENELRDALANDEFMLHYQPKVQLKNGKTTGAEALIRWHHPTRGMLLPMEFMPVAQELGLSDEITRFVFMKVCQDMIRWRKDKLPLIQIAINISAEQVELPFIESLEKLLTVYDLPAKSLAVEIPASALLERMEERVTALDRLHEMGLAVHLDQFGASLVSLPALKSLHLDALKVAPELTRTIHEPGGGLPLVQAILDIAKRFDVRVVAAGIENEWQQAFFKEQRCHEGQGYAFCRPLPGEFLHDWLHCSKLNTKQ